MNEIVKIDAKEAGNKLSVLRHYFLEVLLIVFSIAIVFLFNQQRQDRVAAEARYNENAAKIERYLNDDRKVLIEKLSENTQAINRLLDYLESTKK